MSQIKIKQIEGLQTKLDDLDAQLASGSLKSSYTQTSHGFAAGQVIAYLNGSWVLADSSVADKLGRLVVESVTDADNFVAVQIGNITVDTWSLTPGKFYVVTETGDGSLSAWVNPNDPGFAYSNPVLQAITATQAQVLPWRPSLGATQIAQGQEYTQSDLIPLNSNGGESPTGITLDYQPYAASQVQVYLNGIAVTESYGDKTGDVYFSNDGGATALTVDALSAGSELIWNEAVGGYPIGNTPGNEDFFDLVYEKSSLD